MRYLFFQNNLNQLYTMRYANCQLFAEENQNKCIFSRLFTEKQRAENFFEIIIDKNAQI